MSLCQAVSLSTRGGVANGLVRSASWHSLGQELEDGSTKLVGCRGLGSDCHAATCVGTRTQPRNDYALAKCKLIRNIEIVPLRWQRDRKAGHSQWKSGLSLLWISCIDFLTALCVALYFLVFSPFTLMYNCSPYQPPRPFRVTAAACLICPAQHSMAETA